MAGQTKCIVGGGGGQCVGEDHQSHLMNIF